MEQITFRLADFEGPLDLLLSLVAHNRMSLDEIEIVSLIDQYLAIVQGPQGATLDETSEFIVMAAHLVYLKSAFLLPDEEMKQEVRTEMTDMLAQYASCKQAAASFAEMEKTVWHAVRQPAEISPDLSYHLHHEPVLLVRAYQDLLWQSRRRGAPKQETFDPLVAVPVVSVSSRIVYVLRNLVRGTVSALSGFFSRREGKSVNIATFLAVLELMRSGRIQVDEKERMHLRKEGKGGAQHGSGAVHSGS